MAPVVASVNCFRGNDPGVGGGAEGEGTMAALNGGAVAVAPCTDVRQVLAGESAHPPDTEQQLTRKRSCEAVPYSKPILFLVGAAISSSKYGRMRKVEIIQWIKAHYPSIQKLTDSAIKNVLTKGNDFINTRAGRRGPGIWRLRDPAEFRRGFKAEIRRHSRFMALRGCAPRKELLPSNKSDSGSGSAASQLAQLPAKLPVSTGTEGETQPAPAPLVKIGDYCVTLPPFSVGQKGPPLRFLCSCAIAAGPEQGSAVGEIAAWIAERYSIRGDSALTKLVAAVRRTLSYGARKVLGRNDNYFRRTNIRMPASRRGGFPAFRWVLSNPSDFSISAASYSRYSDPYERDSNPCTGDSDPFLGGEWGGFGSDAEATELHADIDQLPDSSRVLPLGLNA